MTKEGSANALWRIPEWFPELDSDVTGRLRSYLEELLKFNLRLNLVSRNTEREADETHFADCIHACMLLKDENVSGTIYDVGSGNGFPGLVLAILRPDLEVILVESDSRKCEFLKHATHVLKAANANVLNARLESLQGKNIQLAINRGLATLSKSVLSFNKVFAKGGRFYHMKGTNWSTEIAQIPSQLISVWSPRLVGEYTLPDSQARRALVCTEKL